MNTEQVHGKAIEATLMHAHAYQSKWREASRLNDRLFTLDCRRIWCRFDGENLEKIAYPEIREEPFVIAAYIGVETDINYTGHMLTLCGHVIREVHESTRRIDVLGPITEKPRLATEEEISELYSILDEVLVN